MDKDFDEPDDFDELDETDDLGPGLLWPPLEYQPGYPPGYPPPRNAAHSRGMRAAGLAATAVLAGAAGFAVVTALREATASPAADASPGAAAPGTTTPSGGAGNLLPPRTGGGAIPTPGPGQELRLEIGGKVTAVSATSITVGAEGQSVTAAVTTSTRVTGKVHGIGGVKAGDFVAVQITGTDGRLTATAIQDPASIP
jgi:hypothetical protein